MKMTCLAVGLLLAGVTNAASAAPSVFDLRNSHRILIVSSPADSAELAAQRATLASWTRQGEDRDVAPVVLEGSTVEGASDAAATIRARYAIPVKGFAIALVGKDGHVAYRASKPVTGAELEQVIDAMPMRRAGQR